MTHTAELQAIVGSSDWFMRALRAASKLRLSSWCIGAGAVRNLVWDHLHNRKEPSALADVDLAYFDATEPIGTGENGHQAKVKALCPSLPWEVTNQAHVHVWFESYFGHPVQPLHSLEEAVASWPEYATSVGVSLLPNGSLHVIEPHGLDDLFSMRIRCNPARVSLETYRQRVESKRYRERWPSVQIVQC